MTGNFRIIMNSKWSPQIMEQPLVQQRREWSLPQIMSTTRLRSLTTTRWPLWWAMRSLGPLSSSSVQWMRMGMPSPTVLMVGLIYSFNHTNWYTVLMVWVTMVRLISSFGGTIDRENNIKSDNISCYGVHRNPAVPIFCGFCCYHYSNIQQLFYQMASSANYWAQSLFITY